MHNSGHYILFIDNKWGVKLAFILYIVYPRFKKNWPLPVYFTLYFTFVIQPSGHSFCPMPVISKCTARSTYHRLYHRHKCSSCVLNAFSKCQRGSRCLRLCLCWPLLLKAGAGNCFCRSVPGCNWGLPQKQDMTDMVWRLRHVHQEPVTVLTRLNKVCSPAVSPSALSFPTERHVLPEEIPSQACQSNLATTNLCGMICFRERVLKIASV